MSSPIRTFLEGGRGRFLPRTMPDASFRDVGRLPPPRFHLPEPSTGRARIFHLHQRRKQKTKRLQRHEEIARPVPGLCSFAPAMPESKSPFTPSKAIPWPGTINRLFSPHHLCREKKLVQRIFFGWFYASASPSCRNAYDPREASIGSSCTPVPLSVVTPPKRRTA